MLKPAEDSGRKHGTRLKPAEDSGRKHGTRHGTRHRDDPEMVKALKDASVHCKEIQVLGFPRSQRIL